jgi:3',5'-cyclic-AMP phosphodiesterase
MIRLLQITDPHLFADPDGRLLGLPTRRSFEAVLALTRAEVGSIDLVLLTGDLVHDERPEGYRYLKGCVQGLGAPYLAIPGNHDLVALLADHLDPGAAQPVRGLQVQDWHLVLLDSTLPGEDGGRLGPETLEGLDRVLGACPGSPSLVCLHHQPVAVGSPWLDAIGLADGDELLAVLARHPQVRGLIWGHIHQAFDGRLGELRLLGAPSTCVQFLPCSEGFALDTRTPGVRWLELYPDGRMETGVLRLAVYTDPIDLRQTGY